MPGLDHKGPQGEGPMTGRKAGKCTNFGAGRAGKADRKGAGINDTEEYAPVTGGIGAGQGQRQGHRKINAENRTPRPAGLWYSDTNNQINHSKTVYKIKTT